MMYHETDTRDPLGSGIPPLLPVQLSPARLPYPGETAKEWMEGGSHRTALYDRPSSYMAFKQTSMVAAQLPWNNADGATCEKV